MNAKKKRKKEKKKIFKVVGLWIVCLLENRMTILLSQNKIFFLFFELLLSNILSSRNKTLLVKIWFCGCTLLFVVVPPSLINLFFQICLFIFTPYSCFSNLCISPLVMHFEKWTILHSSLSMEMRKSSDNLRFKNPTEFSICVYQVLSLVRICI